MYSRPANISPPSPLSPQSVDFHPTARTELDPNEISNLLAIKGHQTPTYDASSRESTPYLVADAKEWITRIENLRESISHLNTTFALEDWRWKNIVDSRYWQIEADYWELCYNDSLNKKCDWGQKLREEEFPQSQKTQQDLSFFKHTSEFDWLSTYTKIASKQSTTPLNDIPQLVFDTIYQRHRAQSWESLCKKRGCAQTRDSIEAIDYWRKEFGYLFDETIRLEKEVLETKSKAAPRKRAARQKIINRDALIETKSNGRLRDRGTTKKTPKVSRMPSGIRKSNRLRNRSTPVK